MGSFVGEMTKRSYQQSCGLALALDAAGDRWTLLIVRELLIAPRRYGELLAALPQIGTNLLADRLKSLEAMGAARKTLAETGSHHAYELTAAGRALEPAILELVRWGLRHAPDQPGPLEHRDHWDLLAARALFRPRTPVPEGEYALRVDQPVVATVREGRLRLRPGTIASPVASIETDKEAILAIAGGEIDPETEVDRGRIRVGGDRSAALAFLAAFDLSDSYS